MRNSNSYPRIKNALTDSYKNGRIKYSMFVRSSLNEFEELSNLFYLSEIIENLKEDTGIDVSYNSFWQTYNRHRNKPKKVITAKPVLKPSNSVPEFGGESGSNKPAILDSNYYWLEDINMHEKLKEEVIKWNMTESEFKEARINIHSPLQGVKQIADYARSRNLDKNSSSFFNK